MISKNNRLFAGILSILLGFLTLCTFSNCAQQKPEKTSVNEAVNVIKEHALKSNPALRGKKMRVNMAIDGSFGNSADGVCACIQVCDANGQNCTACSCSPANCGSCN